MEKIVLKYQSLSTMLERKYNIACEFLGVRDTTETRVFSAVVVGVVLFYACWVVSRLVSLVYHASDLLLAIVNQ